MQKILEQMKAIWDAMELPQRISMVLISSVFIGLIIFVVYGASRPTWRVLATDLSSARTAEIVAYLQSQNISHRITDRERTILVPARDVYALRNELAELDMIDGDSAGFKLLDQSRFGQSNHMEMRMYDRAVAGELERSFRELQGVGNARVIISRPQPSPFIRDEAEPAISVKLSMRSGRRLSERQIHGITHLAAAAVEGARPDRVQVMDDQGLLSRPDEDPLAMRAGSNFELTLAMEQQLVEKAQRQLDRLVGPGRGTVSLSLDLDFTRRSQATSRVFDPVVIETRTTTRESATPIPRRGGVAGTQPNVEGDMANNAAEPMMATESMEDEHIKRAGSKENTTVEDQVGRIRGMTVSIVVDQQRRVEPVLDDQGNPTGETRVVFQDYSDQQKEVFRQAVLDAIGFAAARGSQQTMDPDGNVEDRFSVSLASVQPVISDFDELPRAAGFLGTGFEEDQLRQWGSWILAAVVALGLLLIARGQLKRAQAGIEAEARRRREEEEARRRAEEEKLKRRSMVSGEEDNRQRRDEMRGHLLAQVANDPDTAAQVVKAWLHE
ncbi:MAG: flagellar M-ring protein FliF [Planctomycetota bacterium]|nr:MAG: flagellar M-ring protein FliF [Planctomycetota bacterium]